MATIIQFPGGTTPPTDVDVYGFAHELLNYIGEDCTRHTDKDDSVVYHGGWQYLSTLICTLANGATHEELQEAHRIAEAAALEFCADSLSYEHSRGCATDRTFNDVLNAWRTCY